MDRATGTAEVLQPAARAYRPDIDGLRCLAVVPVVLFHANLGVPGGFVGVDVFFVISGFLITRIIHDEMVGGTFSYAEFYERRLRRLLPAAFFVFLLTSIYAAAALTPFDLVSYGRSLASASIYLANFNFYWDTGYFLDDSTTIPLLHMWSLAVEEQFYIVVPVLLALLIGFAPRAWVVPVLAGLTVAGYVLCVVLTDVRQMAAYFLLPGRAWELGAGGVLALVGTHWVRSRMVAETMTLGGLGLIAAALFTIDETAAFPGWIAIVPVAGTVLLLAAGHYPGTLANRLLCAKPMLFFGKISYSLYLVHWPIIVALGYGTTKIAGPTAGLAVLLSVGLAWLSFHFVETPVRTRKLLAQRSSLFAFCGAGTALCLAAGLAFYFSGGLPQRFADRDKLARMTDVARWSDPRAECYNLQPGRISAGSFCIRGREGVQPTIALIGDSHAQALAPGFFAAADRAGVAGAQFTSMGYMPLPGRLTLGQNFEPALDAELFRWLDEHPQVATIVLAGFWQYEVAGQTYRHKGVVQIDENYDGSGLAYNAISFRNGMERLLARYPGRKFVILDDVPVGRELDTKHYLRGLVGRGRGQDRVARTEAEAQRASYVTVLRQLAAKHSALTFEEVVFAEHCTASDCPLFGPDGNQRYIDGDHITYQRSLELTDALYGVLQRNIRR